MTLKVSVIGASGYIGGELLRLLVQHPHVEVVNASSDSNAGRLASKVHPQLRGQTELRFCKANETADSDFVFIAVPHAQSFEITKRFADSGVRIVNKSGDFRLHSAAAYEKWYHTRHPFPELLEEFVYGIPELFGEQIAKSRLVAAPGCIATATILGSYPLAAQGIIDHSRIVAEAKIGSSAAGNAVDLSTHHPVRSGVMRSYKPVGHRHTAEIEQALGKNSRVMLSATAVQAVRGVLSTVQGFLSRPVAEVDVWKAFRKQYSGKRFVRFVNDSESVFSFPEPKLLSGTNYCDIGFALDASNNRLVVMSALDNLMKGGAGQGVQCMNLMCGFKEDDGLAFNGLFPI